MDINKYADMVSGVDATAIYAESNQGGLQIIKSSCAPPARDRQSRSLPR